MPMVDAEQATNKFMEDLQAGKFKRQRLPNPPPYFEGSKEQIDNELKAYEEFLQSDLFEHIKKMS